MILDQPIIFEQFSRSFATICIANNNFEKETKTNMHDRKTVHVCKTDKIIKKKMSYDIGEKFRKIKLNRWFKD